MSSIVRPRKGINIEAKNEQSSRSRGMKSCVKLPSIDQKWYFTNLFYMNQIIKIVKSAEPPFLHVPKVVVIICWNDPSKWFSGEECNRPYSFVVVVLFQFFDFTWKHITKALVRICCGQKRQWVEIYFATSSPQAPLLSLRDFRCAN